MFRKSLLAACVAALTAAGHPGQVLPDMNGYLAMLEGEGLTVWAAREETDARWYIQRFTGPETDMKTIHVRWVNPNGDPAIVVAAMVEALTADVSDSTVWTSLL